MKTPSARQTILESYHETTSGISDAYAAGLSRSLRQLKVHLGPWLPPPEASVLDLGCGHGEWLRLLWERGGRDLTGVNLSEGELAVARSLVPAHFVQQDVLTFLGSANRQWDVITAFHFLEHLTKDDLFRCMRGIARALAPNGVLLVMAPNALSPFCGITRHWDLTHEWAFTPPNFRQLAALSGFQPAVEFRECGPIPHGLLSTIRWLLWQWRRQTIRFWLLVETGSDKGGVYTMDVVVRLRKA